MTRAMTAKWGPGVLAAAAAALLCGGCKQAEQRIDKSRPMTPEWVLRTPPDSDALKYYVGRSIAVNALDERRAMNKAVDDAIEQIARSVEVRMRSISTTYDSEDADEARGNHFNRDRLRWETEKSVIVDTIVCGMRHIDSYWELWRIKENRDDGISHNFKRYKYWVLVSFPKKAIEECERQVREAQADELDPLLKAGDDAYDTGRHEEAVRSYQRAIGKYPYARAQVSERMARACSELAATKAKNGDHEGAMQLLRRGYSPSLPLDVKAPMRERFIECYAEEAAARVRELAGMWGWKRVGVASFEPEPGGEKPSKNVPLQIAHVLARDGDLVPSFRPAIDAGGGRIVRGVAYEADADLARTIAKTGDDVLLVGTIGREIATFAYDVDDGRTHPIMLAVNLGAGDVPDGDPARSAWDVFVPRDRRFRVDVWTDRDSYRIGDSVTLYVRANRKCFIVIASVHASGTAQAFIPVLQSRSDFVQPGRTYTVPNENGLPFDLEVLGPAGKETFHVIASEKPLALDDVLCDRLQEAELIAALGSELHRLGSIPWTIAAHAIDVVK